MPAIPQPVSNAVTRFARWLRPTRVRLSPDGPRFLAERITTQFEDELDTRKLKAVRL